MKKQVPVVRWFFFLFLFTLLCLFLYGGGGSNPGKVPGSAEKLAERKLLESLKKSRTPRDRKSALSRLYEYYKQKHIDYLELSYLLKLIEAQKINRDFAGLETGYFDLAEIYKKKRDYLAALDNYFEALVYSGRSAKNRSGYIYLRISEVFGILNRSELANKYIEMALDYAVKRKDEDLKVFLNLAYSRLYYEDGDYSGALKRIDLCIEGEKRRRKYLCAVSSLYQKALILLKLAEEEDSGRGNNNKNVTAAAALELLKQAVGKGVKDRQYNGLLPIMCEYVEKLIEDHQLLEAAGCLDQIDDIYAPYYPYYFFFYYLKALFFEKQNLIHSARRYYRKTAEALETYFSGLHRQQYHLFREKTGEMYSRIIEFYLKLYRRRKDSFYLKKAMYFSEIKNSYIYELEMQNNKTYTHFIEEREKLEQELLRCHKEYLHGLKNSRNHSEEDKKQLQVVESKLETLKRQHEELMEFILESPTTYKAYYFRDFNIPEIQEKLTISPRQVIIKYTVLKDHIHVFYIDRHSLQYRQLTGTAHEILHMVKHLTEPLDDFTRGRVDYLRIHYDLSLAQQLYNILVKGILESLEPGAEIFIIPDGELFKLPFEALVTGFNQNPADAHIIFSEYASANYLIRDHPVSYALSLFHFSKKSAPPGDNKYRYTITGFGCPIIEKNKSRGNEGNGRNDVLFREIPSSERELSSIPVIFGKKQSRVFLREDFNKKTFETYAPESRIVHLATHFINNIYYPQYSALLFSRGQEGQAKVPFYYAHEIFKLNLDTELVVLSACESSEKHLLGFQGMRGMTAAFRHAGVQSMIVGMWPVDDHSCRLTPLFYREYKQKTDSLQLSPALREAKLKLMKQTAALENGLKISFSHPFIWANYILYHFNY
jgi:CHAT domain-containing protein